MTEAERDLRCGGLVLCGGRSARMGQPKHLLPFGQTNMLGQVIECLRQCVDPVIVVAAPDQFVGDLPDGVQLVRDAHPHLGPLSGLQTGLQAIHDQADAVFASGCDTPLLQPAFVRQLICELRQFDLVMCRNAGFLSPLTAVYRVKLLSVIEQLLSDGEARAVSLAELPAARVVEAQQLRCVDRDLLSLRNVNTPQEYDALRAETRQ